MEIKWKLVCIGGYSAELTALGHIYNADIPDDDVESVPTPNKRSLAEPCSKAFVTSIGKS